MKRNIVVLRDDECVDYAADLIRHIYDEGGLQEVIIQEHKSSRSTAQNSLYWVWATEYAQSTGLSKDEAHEYFKERFLLPIYERDDTGYAQMIESLRDVWRIGAKEKAEQIKKQIVRLTSTTNANVDQFTEYLTDIERHAISEGIYLSHPDDKYYQAMGRIE